MDTKVKIIAAFAAGIGCGMLTSYTFFKNKYKKIADEEIAAYESFMKESKTKKRETQDNWKNPVINLEKRTNELTNYNKITDNYISSVPPGENMIEERIEHMHQKMNELAEKEHPEEEIGEQYEITSMDWLDDAFYDKVILTYYTGDDVLANEAGLIDDVDMSIGMELFDIFKNRDETEMYVRNPALGIDYNVVKEMGCYHV